MLEHEVQIVMMSSWAANSLRRMQQIYNRRWKVAADSFFGACSYTGNYLCMSTWMPIQLYTGYIMQSNYAVRPSHTALTLPRGRIKDIHFRFPYIQSGISDLDTQI